MRGFFVVVCLIASSAFATSIDVAVDPQCVLDAAAEGLTAAICKQASDASAVNNFCFSSDVFAEVLPESTGFLTILSSNCPDHPWGVAPDTDQGGDCTQCSGCGGGGGGGRGGGG
mmetsp:Transcript_4574/g.13444  ORF Transcript_4574/g.13444 Transcript_4574/m.13444 type:complete len:115 (+) Transcript_4574:125-469(+)